MTAAATSRPHVNAQGRHRVRLTGSYSSRGTGLTERRALRGVARRRLPSRAKRLEKGDQRRGLGRAQVLAVRGHVAAALDDLTNQLVRIEPHGRAKVARLLPNAALPHIPHAKEARSFRQH